MQTAHVANAASALLSTHALLAPSPVSPRRPLTSAIWPSPRALSPRPLPAATGSLDDFVKRQDAEIQKRLQRLRETGQLATPRTQSPERNALPQSGTMAHTAAAIPISTRRPLTSAVWESPRAAKLDEARARVRAKKQAAEPVGSLEDFVRRQDAQVRKRMLRLEANARTLAAQFTFKPELPPAPDGDDDDAHKPNLAAFLARVSSHLKARNEALEKKREAADKADSTLPRVGARGQSRVWAEKKLPRVAKAAAAHAGENNAHKK